MTSSSKPQEEMARRVHDGGINHIPNMAPTFLEWHHAKSEGDSGKGCKDST